MIELLFYTERSNIIVKSVFLLLMAVALCAVVASAQDTIKAAGELERTRQLVAAGALPRAALEQAERANEKAQLQERMRGFVRRDVGVNDLGAMLEAATRLRDLAREEMEQARARVDVGALPPRELEPFRDALESAEKQLDLAQQRGKLVRQLADIASAEERFEELEEEDLAFAYVGEGGFSDEDLLAVDGIFYEYWGRAMPISANGDTELHRSMGLDHTGRVDVAVHPDEPDGNFLTALLQSWGIPFIAFRSAVPGQATGPHIHIGLPSPRLETDE
jgi:hypothetical protein